MPGEQEGKPVPIAWRQPWIMYQIRCPMCGNNKKGTFKKVLVSQPSSDGRTVLMLHKPRHYICLRCNNEIYWRPRMEDVWDEQKRI